MSDEMKPFDGVLQLSNNLDYFKHGDEFYVFHNLFGYILKMSEDVIEFLEFFREPRDSEDALSHFDGRFTDDMIGEFANVLALLSCLLAPDESEEKRLMNFHPVRAKWIAVHDPEDGPVTICALDQDTKQHVHVAKLDEWDSQLWRLVDGDTTVADLVEKMRSVPGSPTTGLEQRVLATFAHLTNCDMQVLKMSSKPGSTFKGKRHGTPPYLISSMPYEKVTSLIRGTDAGPRVFVHGRRTDPIPEETLGRDIAENRVAYLFREPHPALGDSTYGARLLGHANAHGDLGESPRILEIGGGVGTVAKTFLDALAERDPEKYARTRWTVVTPQEMFAEVQRETLAGHDNVEFIVTDNEKFSEELGDARFDLAICNEFAASLEAVTVRKLGGELEDDEEEEEEEEEEEPKPTNGKSGQRNTFIGEGDAVQFIFRFALPLDDAPADFYMNVGAIRLLEQVSKVLTDNGQFYLIEFGEQYRYPVRTVDEAGVAFSLQFNHMAHVGKKLGLESEFGYLIDELSFERDEMMLSTTRSQFKALRHLLGMHGVTLDRRPWGKADIDALLADAGIGGGQIYDLVYEPLEDRVLGFVMHSLKLQRFFKKPADQDASDDTADAEAVDAGTDD